MTKRILAVAMMLLSSLGVTEQQASAVILAEPGGQAPVLKKHHRTHAHASRSSQRVPLAPAHNWDAVAQCESTGDWQEDTGNGFYGGLQFTLNTWRAFGGTGMPQFASRIRQIIVAEKVLASQGIGAWPVCGKYLTVPAS